MFIYLREMTVEHKYLTPGFAHFYTIYWIVATFWKTSQILQYKSTFLTEYSVSPFDIRNRLLHTNIQSINLLKPTGYMMHQQFNIQQLYALPTLHLCVLYLFENKQRLVPLTA
jgi:hypothetical protein